MKLIVGLGNPELRYKYTRHNAGFWVLEHLGTTYGAHYDHAKSLFADVAKVQIANQSVVLAKPDTYMNLSGKAVQAIIHWYKIEPSDLLVVHDDVSLPLGKIRYQKGGGAGGQHGVENIIQMLGGNKNFDRLKFGIGPDPGGDRRADYVLSPIAEAEHPIRDKVIEVCCESTVTWLKTDATTAANRFNGLDFRPPPPKPPSPPAVPSPQMPPKAPSVSAGNPASQPLPPSVTPAEQVDKVVIDKNLD